MGVLPGVRPEQTTTLFGEWLIGRELIDRENLRRALDDQKRNGGLIGEALRRLDVLSDEQLAGALSEYLAVEYISLADISLIDLNVARRLSEAVCRRFHLIAVRQDEGNVVLAMVDPMDIVAIDMVSQKMKQPVRPVISSARDIAKAVEAVYHGSYIQEEYLRNLVQTETDKEAELIEVQEDALLEDLTQAGYRCSGFGDSHDLR